MKTWIIALWGMGMAVQAYAAAHTVSMPKRLAQSSIQTTTVVRIIDLQHPPSEPAGLYVVNFIHAPNMQTTQYNSYSYRIYCPNKSVRSQSANDVRSAVLEDQMIFGGQKVLRAVMAKVCL